MSNNTYTDPVTGKRYEKVEGKCAWCDFKKDADGCLRSPCDIDGKIFKLIPEEGEAK